MNALSFLLSEAGAWVASIVAAFLAAVWLYLSGRSAEKQDQQIQEYERDLTPTKG